MQTDAMIFNVKAVIDYSSAAYDLLIFLNLQYISHI